jgi:hypothetical protein
MIITGHHARAAGTAAVITLSCDGTVRSGPRDLIAELESNGQSSGHAKYLLAGLELLQAARLDSRNWLLEQLNKKARE